MEMIEITVVAVFCREEDPKESWNSPHPHPYVGPKLSPTINLSLPYLMFELLRELASL